MTITFRRQSTCSSSLRFTPPSSVGSTQPWPRIPPWAPGKTRLLIASQPSIAASPSRARRRARPRPRPLRNPVAAPRESVLWRELADDRGWSCTPSGPHRKPRPVGDTRSFALLARLVARADIVHGHSSKAGFLARLAAAATRRTRRCVFTPHGWSFWAAEGWTRSSTSGWNARLQRGARRSSRSASSSGKRASRPAWECRASTPSSRTESTSHGSRYGDDPSPVGS